jgi:hypothetical protein
LEVKDTYNTIEFTSEEILHKEKNSKFFGSAYPIQSEDEVKAIIDGLRKTSKCRSFCYAYQIGTDTLLIEPMMTENRAIAPECLFMDKFSLFSTNTLVVVAGFLEALN